MDVEDAGVIPTRLLCDMELLFFSQAEDGIRDWSVTGVQTCALPISELLAAPAAEAVGPDGRVVARDPGGGAPASAEARGRGGTGACWLVKMGRGSCRGRV